MLPPPACTQLLAGEGTPSGAAADAARATAFSLVRVRELAAAGDACVPMQQAQQQVPAVVPTVAGALLAGADVPRFPYEQPRLRLLCLHGFRQSGASLAGRLASLRTRLAPYVDFIFLDAPHLLPPPASLRDAPSSCNTGGDVSPSPPPRPRRAWLVSASDAAWGAAAAAAAAAGNPPPQPPPLPAPMAGGSSVERPFTEQCVGWAESLAALVAALRLHAPIDGMLGLSQGAAVAAAAAAELQRSGNALGVAPPRLVWLAGGFVPPPPAGSALHADAPLRLRSLHVFGGDAYVSAAASEALAACFAAPTTLRHAAGHLLPASAADVARYTGFLRGNAAGA